MLLRDRGEDLSAVGVRPLAISRDSVWSHVAWAQALGADVPLLSDWNGEATRAFGVAVELLEMRDVAARSCFLIEDGQVIRAAWMLGRGQPDIDSVVAVAQAI
jgi:glutaredoxin-dependent peroxiredoxin